ncbi:regulatory protein, tetR family [Brevibacterium siliguriense]|uniref:Regulatory protein, tetR family n=1 Tax=Brevibacterium siliguriense TaxID=1136497 RepID=A0A1H1S6D0_9MICO|nr:TetR/AcrR family transcriptional regulator [Brevibacterium siliguriense]SDS43557.1 regulatory protein, tetR family [Brevibacterium siliguriense]
MARKISSYHQRIAADNSSAIVDAAAELLFEHGYDRTSLTRVADIVGVSKATLFKPFPARADLFEAAVLGAGRRETLELPEPVSADPVDGLVLLGQAHSDLLVRPPISALIRTIIAESRRFPELRDKTFDFGTYPILAALRGYLEELKGSGVIGDYDLDLSAPVAPS